MPRVFAALALLSTLTACTSQDEASAVDAGIDAEVSCTTDSDCTRFNYGCAYLIADGCTAAGRCVERQGGACNGVGVCACDGTATSGCGFVAGAAGGYAPKPVRAETACEADASTDGGVCPPGCDSSNGAILCAATRSPCFCYGELNTVPSNCQPGTALVAPPYKAMYCCH